jgi:hypothetical protein
VAGGPRAAAPPAKVAAAAAMLIGLVGVDLAGPAAPAAAGHPDRRDGFQTRSRSIRPAATEFVQQHRLELPEHPGAGPLVQPPPAGGGRAAAQFLGGQEAPRGPGAGHEDEPGDTVAVWDAAWDPAAGRAGAGGSSGWMRCHGASGSNRSTRLVMGREHPSASPNRSGSPTGGSGMSTQRGSRFRATARRPCGPRSCRAARRWSEPPPSGRSGSSTPLRVACASLRARA